MLHNLDSDDSDAGDLSELESNSNLSWVHKNTWSSSESDSKSILREKGRLLDTTDPDNDGVLKHIRDCTAAEAHQDHGDTSWDLSVADLKAFTALLYIRRAHAAKNMVFVSLWSEKCGFPFFKEAIARNRFRAIMRFLRFNKMRPDVCVCRMTSLPCCKCCKPACGNCARRKEVTCVDCEA